MKNGIARKEKMFIPEVMRWKTTASGSPSHRMVHTAESPIAKATGTPSSRRRTKLTVRMVSATTAPLHLRGLQPGATGDLGRADRPLLDRAHRRAPLRRGSGAVVALTILTVSFVLLLLLGVPVAFAIGLSAVCAILWEGLPLAVVFQRMTSGMNIFSFLAIPFFIFAGELMLYGGIADRIVRFAKDLVGHIRGGLGMSNVVAS